MIDGLGPEVQTPEIRYDQTKTTLVNWLEEQKVPRSTSLETATYVFRTPSGKEYRIERNPAESVIPKSAGRGESIHIRSGNVEDEERWQIIDSGLQDKPYKLITYVHSEPKDKQNPSWDTDLRAYAEFGEYLDMGDGPEPEDPLRFGHERTDNVPRVDPFDKFEELMRDLKTAKRPSLISRIKQMVSR